MTIRIFDYYLPKNLFADPKIPPFAVNIVVRNIQCVTEINRLPALAELRASDVLPRTILRHLQQLVGMGF